MANSIDDLENLLTSHGYTCKRMLDVIVGTQVKTSTYKNSAGEKAVEILLTIDKSNDCVAVEILKAFDLKTTQYKEATLACLMAASYRTPLLRASLDPVDGEIRLRIDCLCGSDGARDEDVLRAVAILPRFADAWYPEVESAMNKGFYDPAKISRLDLTRFPSPKASAPATPTADAASAERARVAENLGRASSISRKPGAHVNRLRALLEFRNWLDGQNPGDTPPSRPADMN